jgi:hypothetical protein
LPPFSTPVILYTDENCIYEIGIETVNPLWRYCDGIDESPDPQKHHSHKVASLCFRYLLMRSSLDFGNKVVIAGWGTTDTLKSTDHLQKTYFPIRTPGSEACTWSSSYLQEQHLCIGGIVGDSYGASMRSIRIIFVK